MNKGGEESGVFNIHLTQGAPLDLFHFPPCLSLHGYSLMTSRRHPLLGITGHVCTLCYIEWCGWGYVFFFYTGAIKLWFSYLFTMDIMSVRCSCGAICPSPTEFPTAVYSHCAPPTLHSSPQRQTSRWLPPPTVTHIFKHTHAHTNGQNAE